MSTNHIADATVLYVGVEWLLYGDENGVITGGFMIVNKPGIALPASGSSTGLILLGCASISMIAGILLIAGSRKS